MSDKTAQCAAVPKLRFPEFRDAGEWEGQKLKDIIDAESSNLILSTLDSVNEGYPIYGASGFIRYISSFAKEEDYIAIIKDGSGVGSLYLYRKESSVLGTLNYIKVRDENSTSLIWVFYFLQKIDFSRYIKGSGIPHIYFSDYSCEIVLKPSLKEQQKIADCLASVDDLIAAEKEKLDALQDHKKGLMQQLFPAEKESFPKIRFPEFGDAGGWEKKKIGDKEFATLHKGKGIAKSDITFDGKTPCIHYGELYTKYSEIIRNIFSRTDLPTSELFLSQKNDVIIPSSGETKNDIVTASSVMIDGVALGSDLNVIRLQHNGAFLSYYLNGALRKKIAKIAQGDSVVHLYKKQLEKIEIGLPSKKEQQKIADCLASVDDLIAAEEKKLKALQEHKKGLMQQLFPFSDEVAE